VQGAAPPEARAAPRASGLEAQHEAAGRSLLPGQTIAGFACPGSTALIGVRPPWSDAAATALLFEALRARRDAVARTYFAVARINPADDFVADGAGLRWVDRAVAAGVVAAADARYRYRVDDRTRSSARTPRCRARAWRRRGGWSSRPATIAARAGARRRRSGWRAAATGRPRLPASRAPAAERA
jgi:hypothetical protein